MTVRIARLDSRALIRVSGPDARPFLHNLLTQDVETLSPGELRFGALLSPPGRLLFDLFLWGEPEAVVLDVAADRRDALLQRLAMYRLRAQVTVEADDRPVFAAFGGDLPDGFIADPRVPDLGGRGLGGEPAVNASEDDYNAHRLSLGVPDPAADTVPDKTYVIEANFDLLNGIDFQKGCFVGQETTSRMKRRGAIKTRMLPITFEGAPPPFGAEVLNGELRAGEMLSGRDGTAMALLRLDRLEGTLTVEGKAVEVRRPGWMPS
ncbi:MAG: folate-binding protein [Brevundimonas sp.]|uniref:CAF17-like 4Fe-4S cluster assembly/insertion protein YgfZ n=1 Tax=Brevundimonas sp. TaxID=1871086 RepID=UPI0027232722|nr:folate-binding protein [Brevundimonas sp.]MDO9078681.1 folate-binding protein [Brevundimonas sp.]MDP3081074.1 folate-binding protein [Brevundimonas sp.]MDZ4062914.1 folate-binding protein [Brevundimonas sp.]